MSAAHLFPVLTMYSSGIRVKLLGGRVVAVPAGAWLRAKYSHAPPPRLTRRLAGDASTERGGHYTGPAPEVLTRRGFFSEFFLNAVMSSQPRGLYEFGPFVLNPAECTLLRDGQPVPLRPKVFDILLALVERHGRLVEKDELMRVVWPEQFVEEGNLNKNVSLLRQALGDGENGDRYIETVPKRGYRFKADVRTVKGDGARLGARRLLRLSQLCGKA